MNFQNIIKTILDKMGFLNEQEQLSLTNLAVMVFVGITGFRALFAGMVLHIGSAVWTIQSLDVASTLPVLFSLLNYAHKREQYGKNNQSQGDKQ